MKSSDSFEKFYFAQVATGEACGCAERVIDVYEFNRKRGQQAKQTIRPAQRKRRSFRSWALKYGLLSRKARP